MKTDWAFQQPHEDLSIYSMTVEKRDAMHKLHCNHGDTNACVFYVVQCFFFFFSTFFHIPRSCLNWCCAVIDGALGGSLLNATPFPRLNGLLTFLLELVFIDCGLLMPISGTG